MGTLSNTRHPSPAGPASSRWPSHLVAGALGLLLAAVLAAFALIAPVLWTAISEGLPPRPCLDREPAHALQVCETATEPVRPPAKGALAPPLR
jgi:hypothetical protein